MSSLRGNSARILLLTSAASFTLNGVAAAETLSFEDDPFASLETMSVDELMDARGGYSAGGFKFNIGVSVAPVTVTPVAPTTVTPVSPTKVTPVSVTPVAPVVVTPVSPTKALSDSSASSASMTSNAASAASSASQTASAAPTVVSTPAVETNLTTTAPTVVATAPESDVTAASTTPAVTATESAPTILVSNTEAPTTTQSDPVVTTTPPPAANVPVETNTFANMGGSVRTPPDVTKTEASLTSASGPTGTNTTYASFLNVDLKDMGNISRGVSRSAAFDEDARPAPQSSGVTGDPTASAKPAGETIIKQEGYTVSIDNSQDNVQLNLATEYTVRFDNYREGVQMVIGARVSQTAIGTQTLLGGLSN